VEEQCLRVWSWGEGGGDDFWTRFPSIEAVAESRGRQTPLSGGGGGEGDLTVAESRGRRR
jgi:hypothetical protein